MKRQGMQHENLNFEKCFSVINIFFTYSRGIHVYVFDSGINTKHPDFGGRAYMEASFIDYEDDVDHAGHGKIIICLIFFSRLFMHKKFKTLKLFIGTHVAGTIGGNSYGVAKNVILHGVKILDRNGDGTTAALIQGN